MAVGAVAVVVVVVVAEDEEDEIIGGAGFDAVVSVAVVVGVVATGGRDELVDSALDGGVPDDADGVSSC